MKKAQTFTTMPEEEKSVNELADALKKAYTGKNESSSSSSTNTEFAKALAQGGYQPFTAADADIKMETEATTKTINGAKKTVTKTSKAADITKPAPSAPVKKEEAAKLDGFGEMWESLQKQQK